jgi:hypothetical protein
MNRLHHWYCNREAWKRHVREELVPPAIAGLELGEDVLEVGPGFDDVHVTAERESFRFRTRRGQETFDTS